MNKFRQDSKCSFENITSQLNRLHNIIFCIFLYLAGIIPLTRLQIVEGKTDLLN